MAAGRVHGHWRDGRPDPVNLAPMLAILVILIPALLYVTNFAQIGIQAVATPRHGPLCRGEACPKDVRVTVLVAADGFDLSVRTPGGDAASLKIPLATGDAGHGVHDFAGLYSQLLSLKRAHPDIDTLYLGATPRTPWRVLARTMDAARHELAEPSYDDARSYARAPPRLAAVDRQPVALFGRVALVVAE